MSEEDHEPLSACLTLVNKRGLHARASAAFIQLASQFDAIVTVSSHHDYGSETVVADSIMELLMLGSACGEKVTLSVSGIEAQPAFDALSALITSGFGETE